ncbi:MAG: NYN domain-containing protein, partial [Rubrivivax sp.]|nr:NYN domain-containing protein [Rubrivivax sp.]
MTDRVMLLIDADNVSVDVIEQAVAHLLDAHGALHVRRAYCTADSALKHQAVFRRLQIKPMVNLSTGKNSTDIALAVDAIDLVLAERPDVVAIASSDSDFAPLVGRLREKGCRVVGIGQEGKTGDETLQVYDEFTLMAHRRTRAAPAPRPARKTASRGTATAAAKTAAKTPARGTAAAAA